MQRVLISLVLVLTASVSVLAQENTGARKLSYHSQDIVPIRAKMKYSTLIEVPQSEKIILAATGDKEFWAVDVVNNDCFIHPAKAGISTDLHLKTDKGNDYTFTLQDISGSSALPDLKVLVEPADHSSLVASSGPAEFVPAAQLEQSKAQYAALQSHVTQAVDEFKSDYQTKLRFDYKFNAMKAPFDIESIYHDDKFTYITTKASEKFAVYDMKDGKPNLVSYDLRNGTYVIPIVMDNGYVQLGKKKMSFTRKS